MVMVKKGGIVIIFIVAIILIAVGGGLIYNTQKKTEGYVKTNAVVIDYKSDGNDYLYDYDEDVHYAEIVRYITDKGVFTATNPVYSNSPKRIGSEMEIAYDPENPSHCVFVKSSIRFYAFFLGFGVVFFIIGIVVAILSKRAQNPDSNIKVYKF